MINHNNDEFHPVFIVGNPRSGTTLTAVLLDRHSRIAVPPETNFFNMFLPTIHKQDKLDHETMTHFTLRSDRINDLGLEAENVLKHFKHYKLSVYNLFRVILEEYTKSRGKFRPGEKSPMHIQHVDEIIKLYPHAKVICVMRDGRDVVNSILNTWGDKELSRRIEWLSVKWAQNARLAVKYANKYPDRFIIIKFESLLRNPESELRKICNFIGEEYELSLLNSSYGDSNTIPDWEYEWKGKSNQELDVSRIEAWRKNNNIKQICVMNALMGGMLRKFGYRDTSLYGCPWPLRLRLVGTRLVFRPILRKLFKALVRNPV
ncbi:MAG: sulfotransferase [Kangiella sp.]|nr:sulfotransferase [Kangiella sp.]